MLPTMLLINALVLAGCFLLLWLVCLKTRDVTPVDSFWAWGMLVMAGASFVQTAGDPQRKLLLLALCALWSTRLGSYMIWRWRDHGPDRRYQALLGKAEAQRGWGFAKASALLVFATQAPLLFIVCLPVQLGQVDALPTPGPLAWAGAAVALAGILFETVGDAQLVRFKRDPANAGKVMDRGLWRYTRHPNYFGDALTWWGLYLVAAETATGLWALPGPLLLSWTLAKWSGAPTIERRLARTRAGYADYVARTSGFIPWPPRRA
jgi:steroid 5-alpha reductase family enzyme